VCVCVCMWGTHSVHVSFCVCMSVSVRVCACGPVLVYICLCVCKHPCLQKRLGIRKQQIVCCMTRASATGMVVPDLTFLLTLIIRNTG